MDKGKSVLTIEKALRRAGLQFRAQVRYRLVYRGEKIGSYVLDFVIDEKVVLEIKTGDYFARRNFQQVKAYLHATGKKLALLANFTSQGVKYKRIANIQ